MSQAGPYGATVVPLPVEAVDNDFATDTTLGHFAGYLRAFMNTYGAAMWSSLEPGDTTLVNYIFGHNPSEGGFNTADLPAIYIWRHRIAPVEQVAEDIRVMTSQVTIMWVPPKSTQDWRRARAPVMNGFTKLLDRAIEAGRDPSYVALGDTDPNAVTLGSDVNALGNVFSHWLERVDAAHLESQVDDGVYARFPALIALTTLKEMDHPDYGDTSGDAGTSLSAYPRLVGLDVQVANAETGDTPLYQESIIDS